MKLPSDWGRNHPAILAMTKSTISSFDPELQKHMKGPSFIMKSMGTQKSEAFRGSDPAVVSAGCCWPWLGWESTAMQAVAKGFRNLGGWGRWWCNAGSCSPPARWGLLDFMSVASSCLLLPPPASSCLLPRPPPPPPLLLSSSSSLSSLSSLSSSSSSSNCDPRSTVFPAGPQPRASTPSVPCRTSTATIPAQCSLPDLNHDHPCPVFPAGPQPRVSMPSVPCRTSTASIHAKCSLPDLM